MNNKKKLYIGGTKIKISISDKKKLKIFIGIKLKKKIMKKYWRKIWCVIAYVSLLIDNWFPSFFYYSFIEKQKHGLMVIELWPSTVN